TGEEAVHGRVDLASEQLPHLSIFRVGLVLPADAGHTLSIGDDKDGLPRLGPGGQYEEQSYCKRSILHGPSILPGLRGGLTPWRNRGSGRGRDPPWTFREGGARSRRCSARSAPCRAGSKRAARFCRRGCTSAAGIPPSRC